MPNINAEGRSTASGSLGIKINRARPTWRTRIADRVWMVRQWFSRL